MKPRHTMLMSERVSMREVRLQVFWSVVALLALAGPMAGAAPAGNPSAMVVLPSGRILQVEVADTPAARELGYMFREKISDDEGMVFLMDQPGFHSFWMKNCKVDLDILWLDEAWKVVHLERNLKPCRKEPCPSYLPMQASLYVLELRGGLAAREGLGLGSHIIYNPSEPPRSHHK